MHLIYASDDNGFAGEIQRIDTMNVAETFRRTKTRGKVYRVFDSRLAAGLREVRSYKYRGLIWLLARSCGFDRRGGLTGEVAVSLPV